jgi:hypothetical protein
VRAKEKLTAFLELEAAIRQGGRVSTWYYFIKPINYKSVAIESAFSA